MDELTTIAIDGTGAFDVLMQTVKLHLQEEYDSNRIVGKEYATVYLNAMTAVMQQAVAYLVSEKQVDELEAQTELIQQQTVTELAKTSDTIPDDLGYNSSTSVLGMLEAEKTAMEANTAKLEADTANQTLQTASTIEVNDAQIIKMGADSTDQRNKVTSDIDVNDQQILKLAADITDQTRKVTSDIEVSDQQILKLIADITDQHSKVTSDILVNTSKIDKADGEILLLGQKTISELSKTCDTIPSNSIEVSKVYPWLNDSTEVEGTFAQQNALYAAQTDGFARNAEQKLAKIMVDTWSVRASSDDGINSCDAGLADEHIRSVLNVARVGIDAGEAAACPP